MDFLTVLFTTVSITIIAHRQNPFNINLFLFNVKNRSTRPKIRQIFQKKEETFAKVSLITLHLFYWGGTCSWEMKTNRVLHSVECHSERSGAQAKRSRTRRATASPSESALIFVKVFKVSWFYGFMQFLVVRQEIAKETHQGETPWNPYFPTHFLRCVGDLRFI